MSEVAEFMCQCGAVLRVSEEQAGQLLNCPRCNITLQIPTVFPSAAQDQIPTSISSEVVCGNCQQSNPINIEKCQYCGYSFVEAKGAQKRSKVFFVLPLLTLMLGFVIGVFLCPGYLSIVPPGHKMLPKIFLQKKSLQLDKQKKDDILPPSSQNGEHKKLK